MFGNHPILWSTVRPAREIIFCAVVAIWLLGNASGAELSQTVAAIKPGVVGISTMQKTRSPTVAFFGTGFVVGDGLTVITNAHLVVKYSNSDKMEALGVLVGGSASDFRAATIIAIDKEHDLAVLKIAGSPLPSLSLGDSREVQEGQAMAFTGFPLGMVLGFHHATHRATVAAITPIVQPAVRARQLDEKAIVQLQQAAYEIFQLDGTAYPGNSGSPVYDPATGTVYGIVNMVFVKGLKENAISSPSGISYAIPSNYVRILLGQSAAVTKP